MLSVKELTFSYNEIIYFPVLDLPQCWINLLCPFTGCIGSWIGKHRLITRQTNIHILDLYSSRHTLTRRPHHQSPVAITPWLCIVCFYFNLRKLKEILIVQDRSCELSGHTKSITTRTLFQTINYLTLNYCLLASLS